MRAQDELQAQIDRALGAARAPLLAALAAHERRGDAGPLALLCLAALHDGLPGDDHLLAGAIDRLARAEIDGTYALALRLLVAEACPTFPDRAAQAVADTAALLKNRDGGAFGYRPQAQAWDLSNTQYAALGLRAAVALGVEVSRKVWVDLADTVADAQVGDGGFGYRDGGDDATASMTAAGICVLAVCRQQLERPGRRLPELDRRIKKGWQWLGKHARAIGDAEAPWCGYWHYGLERASILCDVVEVAGVDWYRAGAAMFVRTQDEGGTWSGRQTGNVEPDVATAFAVLFLRRKFQKLAAPVTGARTVVLPALDAAASPADVAACAEALVRRGKTAVPEILQALRSEVEPRRRAALRALTAIAGSDFGIDAALAAAANEAALRKAELWYLRNR